MFWISKGRIGSISVLAMLALALAAGGAAAELLTKGGLSSRSDYLVRVESLTEALAKASDPDAPAAVPSELRAIAVTLAAALQDLRLNEAAIRGGKALPPVSLVPNPAGPGPVEEVGEVPQDWLLQTTGEARAAVARLVGFFDGGGALQTPQGRALVQGISDAVRRLTRPE